MLLSPFFPTFVGSFCFESNTLKPLNISHLYANISSLYCKDWAEPCQGNKHMKRSANNRVERIIDYYVVKGLDCGKIAQRFGKGNLTTDDVYDILIDNGVELRLNGSGKIGYPTTTNLRSGASTNCGCAKAANDKYEHGWEYSARVIYKHRYGDGNLSFDQFHHLTQQHCYWCSVPPSMTYNSATPNKRGVGKKALENNHFTYNGLDRLNCNIGHDITNCVACCATCNWMRTDMTKDEFLQMVKAIHDHQLYNDGFNVAKQSVANTNHNQMHYLISDPILPSRHIQNGKQIPLVVQVIPPNIENFLGRYYDDMQIIAYAGEHTWVCKCPYCPNTFATRAGTLRRKNNEKRSCGCRNRYNVPYWEANAMDIWKISYRDADFSFVQFVNLTQLSCGHCGKPPSNKADRGKKLRTEKPIQATAFIYNGLDRIDNSKGHSLDNVIPSCATCNFARRNMPIEAFYAHI